MTRTSLIFATAAAALLAAAPANAALQVGSTAPQLSATGALAGETFSFILLIEL